MAESSSSKRDEEEEECDVDITPPDGGYGWVIVISSFLIHMLSDGFMYSYGLIFDFLTEKNPQWSTSQTSWLGAILPAVILGTGPIASMGVNRIGSKLVCVVGAILSSVSCILMMMFSNLLPLSIISVLLGLGLGLCYLPAIIMVGFYFTSRRSIALGIAVCGSGAGTLVFPHIINFTLDQYGWNGTFFLMAAIVLNCIPLGMVLRPLDDPKNDYPRVPVHKTPTTSSNETQRSMADDSRDHGTVNNNAPAGATTTDDVSIDFDKSDGSGKKYVKQGSVKRVPSAINNHPSPTMSDGPQLFLSDNLLHAPGAAPPRQMVSAEHSSSAVRRRAQFSKSHNDGTRRDRRRSGTSSTQNSSWSIAGPSATERLGSIPFMTARAVDAHSFSSQLALSQRDLGDVDERDASRCISNHSIHTSMNHIVEEERLGCCARTSKAMKSWFDPHLLKSVTFLIFGLSNFLSSFSYMCPYLYTVTYAKQRYNRLSMLAAANLTDINANGASMTMLDAVRATPGELSSAQSHGAGGIDEAENQYEFLPTAIGAGNIVGRIFFGLMSDMSWVDSLHMYNTCLLLSGLMVALHPLFPSFWWFLTMSFSYGFFIGAYVGLTAVILIKLVGIAELTNAFGLLLIFQGSGTLIGPPILGILSDVARDAGDSEDIFRSLYIVCGIILSLSGIILYPIRPLNKAIYGKNLVGEDEEKRRLEREREEKLLSDVRTNGAAETPVKTESPSTKLVGNSMLSPELHDVSPPRNPSPISQSSPYQSPQSVHSA